MIPHALIGLTARLLEKHYTRAEMVTMFYEAGAADEPEASNKLQLATNWLKNVNREQREKSVAILGSLLMDLMENPVLSSYRPDELASDRELVVTKLAETGFRYITGGKVVSVLTGGATATLEVLLRKRDFTAVADEFERATQNVESEPREAVSAAANILEAICKEYIDQHAHLEIPTKQDLARVFNVVRKDLGLDPSVVEDQDLKTILSGLIGVVNGIAALRTHASSAHAQGTSKRRYRLTSRHARLAVHAAHAIVAFILETWEERW
jgi:hypothetical protein